MTAADVDDRIRSLLLEIDLHDAEGRYLSQELANLERHSTLGLNRPLDTGAAPSRSARVNCCLDQRGRMPECFQQNLIAKADELKVLRDRYLQLLKEKQLSQEHLQKSETHERERSMFLAKMIKASLWEEGQPASNGVEAMDHQRYLKRRLLDIFEECQRKNELLKLATSGVSEAYRKLEACEQQMASSAEAEERLRQVQFEQRYIQQEKEKVSRLLTRKEALLNKARNSDKCLEVRTKEAAKRVEQKRLLTLRAAMRQSDTAIRHRALLIEQLTDKMSRIGEAIRDDMSSSNTADGQTEQIEIVTTTTTINPSGSTTETTTRTRTTGASEAAASKEGAAGTACDEALSVDAAIVEELRRDIEKLKKEATLAEYQLSTTDAAIEILERRIAAVARRTNIVQRRADEATGNFDAFRRVLEDGLAVHHKETGRITSEITSQMTLLQEALAQPSPEPVEEPVLPHIARRQA